MNNKHLSKLVVCPECKGELKISPEESSIQCTLCDQTYSIHEGIPVLLTDKSKQTLERFWQGRWRSQKEANLKWSSKRVFRQADAINLSRKIKIRNLATIFSLAQERTQKPVTLIIGTFALPKKGFSEEVIELQRKFDEAIRLDIEKKEKTTIVGDGHKLPFSDNYFDLIIAQAVIKHLSDPIKFISELCRVLNKDGYLYIEVAYLLPYHRWPGDYVRYTPLGVKELLKDFDIVESGFIRGPSQTVADILAIYMASLCAFNKQFLYSIFVKIFSWILHPLKYLDYVLIGNQWEDLLSQVNYYIVKKDNFQKG